MVRTHSKAHRKSSESNSANLSLLLILIIATIIAAIFVYQRYYIDMQDTDVSPENVARKAAVDRLVPGTASDADRERQLQRLDIGSN